MSASLRMTREVSLTLKRCAAACTPGSTSGSSSRAASTCEREGGASANKGNRRGKGGGDETIDDDLIVNLFPGDTGADTPNIANKLRVAGFEYDRSRRDRPYRWAQHLAGLDFLAPVPVGRGPGADAETGVAKHQQQARVRNVLAALRARMASRSALK